MSMFQEEGRGLRLLAFDSVLVGVLTVALGLVFALLPQAAGGALCLICGIILACAGIAIVVGVAVFGGLLSGYSILMGVALVLTGAFCLFQPALVMGVINVLLGLFIVLDATTSLVDGVRCVKAKVSGGVALVVVSAILVICGVLIMFGPYQTATALLGWVLVFDGIADIVLTLALGKKVRQVRQAFGFGKSDDIIDIGEQ